jgi:hypothetical protein
MAQNGGMRKPTDAAGKGNDGWEADIRSSLIEHLEMAERRP